MNFLKYVTNMSHCLSRYPNISKAVSTFLGLVEVPILEFIHFLDKDLNSYNYEKAMNLFNRIYGSRVIPLSVNLEGVHTISPTEELLNIIHTIPSLAVSYCYCRAKHRGCNHNRWTCIHIGTAKSIKELRNKIPLRTATMKKVESILYEADNQGLVHQLITTPNPNYFHVICNCCPCCCVMLQSAIRRKRSNVAIASNFISTHSEKECVNCGECANRCYFGARVFLEEKLVFNDSNCLGCGLCVKFCKKDTIKMVRRILKKEKIPVFPLP